MGLPSIVVMLAENQRSIAQALSKSKVALLIEASSVIRNLSGLIEMYAGDLNMRLLLSQNAAQVCEGVGVQVITSIFQKEPA